MRRACVLLANGFEEIEALTAVDVLRRAGVDVKMVGLGGRRVTGAHDVAVVADETLKSASTERWDAVILPGGMPGSDTLRKNQRVRALVRAQFEAGRLVAAICAAPMALGAAGILRGRKATCYPGCEAELAGAKVVARRVVVDRNLVTSRGPGTALEFALTLAEKLAGKAVATRLRRQMLVGR